MSVDKLSSQPAPHNLETTKITGQKESTELDSINKKGVQDNQIPPSIKEMESVIEGINEMLQPARTHLKFELHEKLSEYYVTVIDNNTNEIIREIPSKKWLDFYAAMTDFIGLIVDKKV